MTTLVRMTEAELMHAVTDLATLLGWSWVHFRPAMTQHGYRTPVSGPLGKGWPDLVLVRTRDRRCLFLELKADGGKLTPDQKAVLDTLADAGREVAVLKPVDLDDGSLMALLR